MTLCTLKSTVAFFTLFLFADMALLLLGVAYVHRDAQGMPNSALRQAGGFFGIMCGFLCWYNSFAGLAEPSNTYFIPPVVHFPWSDQGKKTRRPPADGAELA